MFISSKLNQQCHERLQRAGPVAEDMIEKTFRVTWSCDQVLLSVSTK